MFGESVEKGEPTGTDVPLEDSETKWEFKIGENGEINGQHSTAAMTKVFIQARGIFSYSF